MSNWTHVAGIIRIDDLRFDDKLPDFEKIFGKSFDYFDENFEEPMPDEEFLPYGSEGTLEMSVVVNPNKNSVPAYVVSIYGDLRDHNDPTEIIKWFMKKCDLVDKTFVGVRNACIVVENECNGKQTWFY